MAKNLQTAATTGAVPGTAANAAQPLPGRRPRGRPRKTHSELDEGNRRRLIIEGAARLFRAKGFAAASTRDIAAAAGMHGGSPFYHFESKNALLYVVMQEGMAQAAASQQAALDGVPANAPARERLRTLIRNHFQVLLGPGSDFIPVMLYEWRSLNDGQRAGISQLTGAYEAQWMPTLRALHADGALKADPRTARLFIFGALNWSVQWFSPRGAQSLDGLTEQALALFVGQAEPCPPRAS